MGKQSKRLNRKERIKQDAFESVRTRQTTIRKAAGRCYLPPSTFLRQYRRRNHPSPTENRGRRPALTPAEEDMIVTTLLRFAHRGYNLERADLIDCVEIVCNTMPADRRKLLPFKNNIPSKKFAKGFESRHKHRIKFGRSSAQEGQRFDSTNAKNLTSYLAELEAVIRENNIDPQRIANLDESGVSPDRDRLGRSKRKHYGTRSTPIEQKLVQFTYKNRVTIMPVIFADGTATAPLFVFKDSKQPYRIIQHGRVTVTEMLEDCLPRKSLVFMREDIGGVDKRVFFEWAKHFVKDTADLRANARKILLIYDAYRSHMSLDVLLYFEKNGIIAFALPAHTSGITQPLDVGIFQPFKAALHNVIRSMCSPDMNNVFDVFDLCKCLSRAYVQVFTVNNITHSFAKAGIHPFDPTKLIGVSRPMSENCPSVAVTPAEMEVMLNEKREMRRESGRVAPIILKRGFLDTKEGLVLTSSEALAAVRVKEENDAKKRENKYNKAVCSDAKFEIEAERRRAERRALDHARAVRHKEEYNEPYKLPRSIKDRRSAIKRRLLLKKAAKVAEVMPNGMTREEFEKHLREEPSQDLWELRRWGEI